MIPVFLFGFIGILTKLEEKSKNKFIPVSEKISETEDIYYDDSEEKFIPEVSGNLHAYKLIIPATDDEFKLFENSIDDMPFYAVISDDKNVSPYILFLIKDEKDNNQTFRIIIKDGETITDNWENN